MGEGRRREKAVSRPLPYRFLFFSRFYSFRVAELLYALISGLPQDGKGGGGKGVAGNPREIWHFQVVNFPTLEFPL